MTIWLLAKALPVHDICLFNLKMSPRVFNLQVNKFRLVFFKKKSKQLVNSNCDFQLKHLDVKLSSWSVPAIPWKQGMCLNYYP